MPGEDAWADGRVEFECLDSDFLIYNIYHRMCHSPETNIFPLPRLQVAAGWPRLLVGPCDRTGTPRLINSITHFCTPTHAVFDFFSFDGLGSRLLFGGSCEDCEALPGRVSKSHKPSDQTKWPLTKK